MAQDLPGASWSTSPKGIQFLSTFRKPTSLKKVTRWMTSDHIGLRAEKAVVTLLADGLLRQATVEEALMAVFSVADLRSEARTRGLRVSGAKRVLVERLIATDSGSAAQLVAGTDVHCCTRDGLDLLSRWETQRTSELEAAQAAAHQALLAGDARTACRAARLQLERWGFQGDGVGETSAAQIEGILSATPSRLQELQPLELTQFRAAVAMTRVFPHEALATWLPSDFRTLDPSWEICANHLDRYVRFRDELAGAAGFSDWVRIAFWDFDAGSCDRCFSLRDRVIAIDEFPELPHPECTSLEGCTGMIEPVDRGVTEVGGAIVGVVDFTTSEPVARLDQARELLERGLITKEEFERKKQQILDEI